MFVACSARRLVPEYPSPFVSAAQGAGKGGVAALPPWAPRAEAVLTEARAASRDPDARTREARGGGVEYQRRESPARAREAQRAAVRGCHGALGG